MKLLFTLPQNRFEDLGRTLTFTEAITDRLVIERAKIDICGGGTYKDRAGYTWGYDNGVFVGKKSWANKPEVDKSVPLKERMKWLYEVEHKYLASVSLMVEQAKQKIR